MKYANKMMMVPFVQPKEDPEDAKIRLLDNEMSAILTDKKFSFDDKIKLYNMTLAKYIQFDKPDMFPQASIVSNQPVIKIMPQIKKTQDNQERDYHKKRSAKKSRNKKRGNKI